MIFPIAILTVLLRSFTFSFPLERRPWRFAKSLVKGSIVILRLRFTEFVKRIAKIFDGPRSPGRENPDPAQRAKPDRERERERERQTDRQTERERKTDRQRERERRRLTRRSISNKTGGVNRAGFKIFSDVQVIGIALPVFGRSLITKGICF